MSASPARTRSRTAAIIVAALAVITITLFIFLWNSESGGGTGSEEPLSEDPSSDETATTPEPDDPDDTPSQPPPPLDIDDPEAGPVGDEDEEVARASETVEAVVDVTTQVAQRADGQIGGLDDIATGFVLGEIQALSVEREHLELTQNGQAQVISIEAVSSDLDAEQPQMVLSVCVDVSEIELVDGAGNSQNDLLYDPGRPVRHLYGAEYVDDVWKLSTHEIPDEQDCPDSDGE